MKFLLGLSISIPFCTIDRYCDNCMILGFAYTMHYENYLFFIGKIDMWCEFFITFYVLQMYCRRSKIMLLVVFCWSDVMISVLALIGIANPWMTWLYSLLRIFWNINCPGEDIDFKILYRTWFPYLRVAANKEATAPRVPDG